MTFWNIKCTYTKSKYWDFPQYVYNTVLLLSVIVYWKFQFLLVKTKVKSLWMYGWMGGWVDGWMDEWIDGWIDGWMGGWMDGLMDGCFN